MLTTTCGAPRAVKDRRHRLHQGEKAQRMASKKNDSRSTPNESHCDDPQRTVLERVQELTWAMLDGEISDDEMSLLDTLLLTGGDARNRYIECVQLHTDLMAHYAQPSKTSRGSDSQSPVLSLLSAGSPSLNMPSPRTAE